MRSEGGLILHFRHLTLNQSRSLLFIMSWSLSTVVGTILANVSADVSAKLVYAALIGSASFLPLFGSLLFCLFFVFFFICIRAFVPLCLIIILEGVSLGYCLMGTLLAFGSAGWMFACALMSPHIVLQFILFLFSFKYITQNITVSVGAFVFGFAICFTMVCIYILVINPFINDLL